MFDMRRSDHGERVEEETGYAETDPSGRYGRFKEVLGKGAMKTVYRAFDELNGIEVAWNQAKLCDVLRSPDALQRMYSEVHLLSTLEHDSIIQFHASWVDVGRRTFNFITELFTSGTLREYRQRYRRVDIRAVKNWTRQILHGLDYLHSHDPPVIHRDLKCDNIFVNGHLGQIKIGDLGLAAVLRGSQAAHSVIGTPEFMAPELYEEDYNELVDMYSFGMCVLEMLTSEYPYSECSNPAQIYKKVTSGKLPEAFYKIQDPEARRFVARCLETVSKRSSAKELLLDPFLSSEDHQSRLPRISVKTKDHESVRQGHKNFPEVRDRVDTLRHTDMTITGKINPEDDTIFLKVQIADKHGQVRNIYFPFDILSDTPIDVAYEMVKELEISDREPTEIAEVISQEISNLVPQWRELAPQWREGGEPLGDNHDHYVFNYNEDLDECQAHPFHYLSSPSSSQCSVSMVSNYQMNCGQIGESYKASELIQDDLCEDYEDDTSSLYSEKYSSVNYNSAEDQGDDEVNKSLLNKNQKSTRFRPEECHRIDPLLAAKFNKQCNLVPQPECSRACNGRGGKRPVDGRRLMRNRSYVDVRSQLLHRTLVEELNKRAFKTVGSVENIGFQMPSLSSGKGSSSSAKRGGRKQTGG